MNYLIANIEINSYDTTVTTAELWQAVGAHLVVLRIKKKWNPIDVSRHGGPNYATVQAIERGEIGRVEKLEQHARALGFELADVLATVLKTADTTLTPEEHLIVRKYRTARPRGRAALVAMADALDPDTPEEPNEPPDADLVSTPGTPPVTTATPGRTRHRQTTPP